ncbi:hypothetical protein EV424DRAFT_1340819 [Suillus variegatus]|nr:hypothetical protein EV424DRAFT_1340819 [Suillus variegatus]
MVQTTEKEFNGLDVMVANTSQIIVKSVVNCKPAPSLIRFYGNRHTPKATLVDFDWIFNVRTLLVWGKKGMPSTSVCCASKSTIQSFTQVLASEIGSQGITVNVYAAPEQSIRVSFMHPDTDTVSSARLR